MMFIGAKVLYEVIGDQDKAKKYQDIIDEFQKELVNNTLKYGDDNADKPIYFNEPIVKDKKIYPNDPCPCGSGKKYKKCCGSR